MRRSGTILVLGAPTVIALWFISGFALTYFTTEPAAFGIYWPRHQWLLAHVIAGIVALLSGPAQLWLGINTITGLVHRILGVIYLTAVAVSGMAALYLAVHTDFGWVFGMGFITMTSAWWISTALAVIAICLHRVEQHREWMIRSYVLTFSFVTFRVLEVVLDTAKLGTIVERKAAASWMALTISLLLTECILQSRKIFARRVNVAPLPTVNAYTAAPEPPAFDLRDSESFYQHQP
jgi:Predicted membrane protein (DUF2306)